jgi:putative FmdB family regulatory protein
MIYEYECPTCYTTREITRKMTDPEETVLCTGCQQVCVRKWNSGTFIPGPGMYSYDNKKQ